MNMPKFEDRDRFLTEAMGECYHNNLSVYHIFNDGAKCFDCREEWDKTTCNMSYYRNDFSEWEQFGKLWKWCINQDWWVSGFKNKWWGMLKSHHQFMPDGIIDPDKFADAIYAYLKNK